MPGTRGAPVIDALNLSKKRVSIRYVDHTGDIRTDTYDVDPASYTDLGLDGLVDYLQALTNASIWSVEVQDVYGLVPDTNNATEQVWENVQSNVVVQLKSNTGESTRMYIPSPIEGMFVAGTDTPDKTYLPFTNAINSFTALQVVGFQAIGARFTHRRDINQQVKF